MNCPACKALLPPESANCLACGTPRPGVFYTTREMRPWSMYRCKRGHGPFWKGEHVECPECPEGSGPMEKVEE